MSVHKWLVTLGTSALVVACGGSDQKSSPRTPASATSSPASDPQPAGNELLAQTQSKKRSEEDTLATLEASLEAARKWAMSALAACMASQPFTEPSPSGDSVECKQPGGKKPGWFVWKRQSGVKISEGAFIQGQQTGVWTDYHPGGRPYSETTYQKGKKHGPHTSWHLFDGRKWIQGEYRDDKEHGTWQHWREDGSKHLSVTFRHGKRHGPFTSWYENGAREQVGEYRDDKAVGTWVTYHPGGGKAVEGEFRDGKRQGLWTMWAQDGRIFVKAEFRDNELAGFKPYRQGKAVPDKERPDDVQCNQLVDHIQGIAGQELPPAMRSQLMVACTQLMTRSEVACQMKARSDADMGVCLGEFNEMAAEMEKMAPAATP
jgi:antitoxin component YwqK of YwqJK toxin-antitoxin module